MTSVTTTTRYAFLTPGHNCWSFWNSEGNQTITNPGASHRALETLAYAIDQLANHGWQVKDIFVEQGSPALVLLSREETRTL